MAENSLIEWTDHTFNPWIGCTKVSPACDNCYAAEMMDTRYGRARWGAGDPTRAGTCSTAKNISRGPSSPPYQTIRRHSMTRIVSIVGRW